MQHDDTREVHASLFRELLELAPEAVVMGDRERRIEDANTAACRLYGYGRDELLRMTFRDLVEPDEAPCGTTTFRFALPVARG